MVSWAAPPLPPRLAGIRQIPLVGRRHERRELEEAWAQVEGGHRQAVFIGGEPGVGKTRLAGEAAISLHAQGATVLVGASAQDPDIPYRPFVEILDHLFAHGPTDPLEDVLAEVGHHVSHLSRHVRDNLSPGPARRTTRQELYEAVARVLRAVARFSSLVLVVDDLHWAQANSLGLLAHIIASNHDTPMLILGTFRTTAPDRSDELTSSLAALHRLEGIRRFDLTGLENEAVAEYLIRHGGVTPQQAHTTAPILRDRTGGNPFFLKELWHDLGRREGIAAFDRAHRVPSSIRDTLERAPHQVGRHHAEDPPDGRSRG